MKKLEAGEDFATLAKAHSEDTHADAGGLWKDTARGDVSMELALIIFETKETDLIGPLEDQVGFQILKIVERKLGPAPPFEEAREELKRRVISEKKKANFEKWMKKMRSRAVIKKMI